MAGRKFYKGFVDLEKAFDCFTTEMIWWTLEKKRCDKKKSFCHYRNVQKYENIHKNQW